MRPDIPCTFVIADGLKELAGCPERQATVFDRFLLFRGGFIFSVCFGPILQRPQKRGLPLD
jgi:hypothetical protein